MSDDDVTWSMSWGEEATDSSEELLFGALPHGQMLVAQVLEATATLTTERVRYLLADSEDGFTVRNGSGVATWRERDEIVSSAARTGVLPDPQTAKALAMVNGYRLIEWLAAESFTIDHYVVVGRSASYGNFAAQLHREYGFVIDVEIRKGDSDQRSLRMNRYRLIPLDRPLLEDDSIEPSRLENLFQI